MIGWLTAAVIVIVAVVLLWAMPKLGAGRRVAAQSGELAEGLQVLAGSLGLDDYDQRTVFGDVVHRLTGEFNRLRVDVEVQVGRRFSYTRINVEFPQTIDQDLTILSDRKPALRNWLLRQHEVSIGVDDFDRDFILMARHGRRLEALLSPAIQFQLRRLIDLADTLEVGDESVFVLAREMVEPSAVSTLVKKTLETAERVYATAVQLGPSPSKVEASVYSQATADIYARDEELVSSDTASSAAPASSSDASTEMPA